MIDYSNIILEVGQVWEARAFLSGLWITREITKLNTFDVCYTSSLYADEQGSLLTTFIRWVRENEAVLKGKTDSDQTTNA